MREIKQLHYRQKGHMGQYEQWWHLMRAEDGSLHVRYSWDDVKVGTGEHSEGETFHSVESFLARSDDEKAVRALKEHLGQTSATDSRGGTP